MSDNFTNTGMDILEEPISDLEAKRIKRLIAKKVSQNPGQKRPGVALLACCIMLTGMTALPTELNIVDAFRAILVKASTSTIFIPSKKVFRKRV